MSVPSTAVGRDLVVIVHPASTIEELGRAELIHLFLGRQRRLPGGQRALVIDLVGPGDEKRLFYARLVGKDLAEIQSYWARLVFTGRGSAPWQAESVDELLDLVHSNPGAIGYLDEANVDHRARVVFRLTP
ncbi:hypothetical protein ABC977_09035 [Thioalkalicoccus limnaeus]|uniref:Uncharacterized protein n=1 Tax=Thioalkalicoccus limnaeus TaxID=120681 RepID=A0ABV4BE22_9GAMM